MKVIAFLIFILFLPFQVAHSTERRISEDTDACLECHRSIHPGIVAGWEEGRMSRVTPEAAMKADKLMRRVSIEKVPGGLADVVVGCAECHMLNAEEHKDTFEHNGYKIHTVVSPGDCQTCHPTEVSQYHENLMSQAYGNLQENPLYKTLADSINGVQSFQEGEISLKGPDEKSEEDSCLYCHGTKVSVKGTETRETDFGDMEFPVLSGWPNRGVGRINPDGTKGACTACHTRHGFRIEMARNPKTCSECHSGPDVPAYKIYSVSKHGNIHTALGREWDFGAVPWEIGKDFKAPTCATCHVSLLVSGQGDVIAQRSHRMNDRIPWRLFGLIYAHAHPKESDTTIIVNSAGLPLPTELTGEPVERFLIDKKEQDKRLETMQGVCMACHSQAWVFGHFDRLKNTMKTSNEMVLASTKIVLSAWNQGSAKGPSLKENPFDEAIEKMWVEQWLFFANSTRLASAMAGSDYGVFENGRWYMARNIQEMFDWLRLRSGKKR